MIIQFKELITINEEPHLKFMISQQNKGGWGEFLQEPTKHVPSPIVTAQVILGMVPYLNFHHLEHLKPKIIESVKIGTEYLLKNFHDFGWGDHSGGHVLIDASGAVITAIMASIQLGIVQVKNLEIVKQALSFILQEQNDDGGWGIRKDNASRVQFTYWALKALKTCEHIQTELTTIPRSEEAGINWLSSNLRSNQKKGLSIFIDGELSPIATALGVEILHEFSVHMDKEKITNFFQETQIAIGRWETQTDAITFGKIPRRVYVFNDWARIIECFSYLDIKFDSDIFQDTLKSIMELEVQNGGFRHREEDICPVGWFTAQVLKALATLRVKFDAEYKKYLRVEVPMKKIRTFSKAILMVGRFRPPHIGHYLALKAILYSDKSEFLLSHEAMKELIGIDRIFIGIARYGISKENPWSIGEIREIWCQVIDNDEELKKKNHLIEIVSCPAQLDLTNVVDSIDEITYKRDSIVIVSGNSRIIEQCEKNNMRYLKFKRSGQASGTRVREILSETDFDNLDKHQKSVKQLKEQLHPAAFQLMMQDGLFIRAQNRIKAQ